MMNTFDDGYRSEFQRVIGIIQRDGLDAAIKFAERTLCIYHAALENKEHFASSREFRNGFIGSICYLESFLEIEDPKQIIKERTKELT